MKATKLLTITALAVSPSAFGISILPVHAAMAPESCQPLTGDNRQECCAAENWRELIAEGDVRFCPRLDDNDRDSGRLGEELNPGGGNNGGPDTTGSVEDKPNNPGNEKPRGNAGEQDKGPDDSPPDPSGTKGNSN